MRLDWNDIKARAAKFADDWKDAAYERGETQSFYNDFFEVFGVKRRRVASFEHSVKLLGSKRGYLDLFWKGKLLIEQKSARHSLVAAKKQALEYFPGLKDHELPRYLLLSDFQTFELYDLDIDADKPVSFRLANLADNIQSFGFIVGQERRVFRDQDPVNIAASEMMGALHDALEASGYKGHDLERLLVRLLFCLFANTTGIFQPLGIFDELIRDRTSEDGTDVGRSLGELFQVLNTPENELQKNLSAELKQFPYINGELFAETLRIPAFNRDMRDKLLNVCGFNWEKVSPAIFGSLFQSVMDKQERRKKGAHYTSEKNILKVIEPLFMDDLRAEFERVKGRKGEPRRRALQDFFARLRGLTFFDPACGCGNFLVIAYRELRMLEIELIREFVGGEASAFEKVNAASLSVVNVDQFYGIEIEEFPARIAEVAMWMMDHIMNVRLAATFGQAYARIPLKTSPNIRRADALETDWAEVLPPDKCSFVFGNPPFIGAKVQSEKQRAQVRREASLGGSGGTLDYVCAWFLRAGSYVNAAKGARPRIAFVATNSITQGEQVAQLWPVLFGRFKLEISFGHRTFEWMSDARGKAHVHCVILGLTRRDDEVSQKRLFSYDSIKGDPAESRHGSLSPYLFDASGLKNRHLVVEEVNKPLLDVKRPVIGSKPIDGGYYIFTEAERAEFLVKEPGAAQFLRPYIGSEEFINGKTRYILALQNATPAQIRNLPEVKDRISKVRRYRLGEIAQNGKADKDARMRGQSSTDLAETPTAFHVTVIPKAEFLAIPKVSSERRAYVPIGLLRHPVIASDLLFVIEDATLSDFALITSRMHMAWLRNVGGRLESRYRYSIGIVYNTFPWPQAEAKAKAAISALAQAVLDARLAHPGSTLADLYDPDVMPPDLRRAHRDLDDAVDKLYRPQKFASDRERVEHLFTLYEKLTADLLTGVKAKPGKPRGKRKRG